ncbi:MAG: hypothetical protein A3G08_02315 [Candidatus Magasanikbacteria bacterium RIFCSPLOWO2_12_FULL_47_9b]|nr:MAG: hypothetical protein A3G08_02315 [Candidatus Magasanikbacteria bacterium RIFCSPLOWO2_12_FULL_47_9b]
MKYDVGSEGQLWGLYLSTKQKILSHLNGGCQRGGQSKLTVRKKMNVIRIAAPDKAYEGYWFPGIEKISRELCQPGGITVVPSGIREGAARGWLDYFFNEARFGGSTVVEVPVNGAGLYATIRDDPAAMATIQTALAGGARLKPFCVRSGDGLEELLEALLLQNGQIGHEWRWGHVAADPPWVTDGPNNKAEFYRLIEAAGLDRLLIRPYEICTGADAIRTAFSRVFTEFGAVAVKLPGRASGDGILVTSDPSTLEAFLVKYQDDLADVIVQRAWVDRVEMSVGTHADGMRWYSQQLVDREGHYTGSLVSNAGYPAVTDEDRAWMSSAADQIIRAIWPNGTTRRGVALFDVLRNRETGERGIIEACMREPGSDEIRCLLSQVEAHYHSAVPMAGVSRFTEPRASSWTELRACLEGAGLLYRSGERCRALGGAPGGVTATMIRGLEHGYCRLIVFAPSAAGATRLLDQAREAVGDRNTAEIIS